LKISISHPHGNANSYQAAVALADQEWLCSFQTGLVRKSGQATLLRYLPDDFRKRALNRNYEDIPRSTRRSHLLWEAISRIGKRVKPAGPTSRVNWYDVLFCGHDFQVSKSLEDDLDAIYAYEDAAKWTFTVARRRGARAIYELPLGYYRAVAEEINHARTDRSLGPLKYGEPDWKQSRKDAELEMADLVVVPCAWARESLRYSRLHAAKPSVTIPYGTPADQLQPRSERPAGPFTVLFAGQAGLRKGVPHLIEAWERLALKEARLWLAGSMSLDRRYLAEHAKSFEHLGTLPRSELLDVMRQADLFAFPSLAEGFGLVIGEAMACGVPVLTTANTGGPELITDGREGWCVPAHSVAALVERLEWAYQHRDKLFEMGKLARLRAEQWTWKDYRQKLVQELAPHLR
jgi:starch synthase